MFEIGFSELLLIGVIALLVFGPDKLPGLARNVGLWVGRIKRMVGSVQQEFHREIAKAEELKRLVEEQQQILERHVTIEEDQPTVPVTGKPAALPASAPPAQAPAAATAPEHAPVDPPAVPAAPAAAVSTANETEKVR
jgi:sec-independent protein translocase protein TatB